MTALDTWRDLGVVIVSEIAPAVETTDVGRLWWQPSTQGLSIWIDGLWKPLGNGIPHAILTEALGAYVFVSETDPQMIDEFDGDLWFRPSTDEFFIRVDGQWSRITLFGQASPFGAGGGAGTGAPATGGGFGAPQVIDLNQPGGANVGAAATAWGAQAGNKYGRGPVYGQYSGSVYLLTNPAAPDQTASWLQLGGDTMPKANRRGEIITSKAGPGFDWQAGGSADLGRY